MKGRVKRFIALSLAAISLAGMAGCGEKKQSGTDGKITITMWNKPSQDAKQWEIEQYEKTLARVQAQFPDVIFDNQIRPAGGDYRQEYDKALMAGKAPDIFNEFSYTDIPSRITNGTVADITDLVNNWDLKKEGKIIKTFDTAISRDGKWYAVPFKAYTQATMVNLKTLKAAGEDVSDLPNTWEEFGNVGARVTDFKIPRIGYSLVGMDWCAWPYTAWVWSAGGEMVRENGDGTVSLAFTEDAGIDAAMYMNSLIWDKKMTQKDILIGYDDLKKNIQNGTACFAWATFSDLNKEDMVQYGLSLDDYSVMPMPVKDESIAPVALAGGEVITFNPKMTEEELKVAFEVAQAWYLSDEAIQESVESNKAGNAVNTFMPGRADKYDEILAAIPGLSEDAKAKMLELAACAKVEPYCEHWSDLKSQLAAPLQKIFLKEGITRDEAKEILEEVADKLYELYPETFKKQ